MVDFSKVKGEVMAIGRPILPVKLSSQLREQLQTMERSLSIPQALAQHSQDHLTGWGRS